MSISIKKIFWNFDEDRPSVLVITSIIILIVLSIVFCILFIDAQLLKKSCLIAYKDYHAQWSYWGGCQIGFDGRLTPVGMIKNVNAFINK